MSKKEQSELRLLSFLFLQELQVEIICMPEILMFEHSIVRPN